MTRPALDYTARLSAFATTAADHQPATCPLCLLYRAEEDAGMEPTTLGRYLVSPSSAVVVIIEHDEEIDTLADDWLLVRAASESHARDVARATRRALRSL